MLLLNSVTPEQMSTHPLTELLGSKYLLVLKNAKGNVKLQDSWVWCLISVLRELLLVNLFNLHLSVLYLFFRTLTYDHPSTPRLYPSSSP